MSVRLGSVLRAWRARGLGVQLRPGRRARWVAALTVGTVVLAVSQSYQQTRAALSVEQRRVQVSDRLARYRAQLEQELATSFSVARGLALLVAAQGGIDDTTFARFASVAVSDSRYIRQLTIAPDNRVAVVHPRTDGAAMRGQSLLASAPDSLAVREAMRSGRAMLGGPTPLPGGGEGFTVRMPILLPTGGAATARRYWGMASVVLDADLLLAEARVPLRDDLVRYAMRGVDGRGPRGRVWFGDTAVISARPITVGVAMPDGQSWALSGAPVAGWSAARSWGSAPSWLGLLVAVLAGAMAYWLFRERQLVSHIALHDPLSGLPNRLLVNDRLMQAVRAAARTGQKAGVIALDLDDFKPVNDTYGHHVGDTVLAQVGERLQRAVRESDTVGRVGGDEFLVILPGIHGLSDAEAVARKITASLTAPFAVAGGEPRVGTSWGLAVYPDDAVSVPGLLSVADARLYAAKDRKPAAGAPPLAVVRPARIDRAS